MPINYYLGAIIVSTFGTIVLGFFFGIFFLRKSDGKLDTKAILSLLAGLFIILIVITSVVAAILTYFPPPAYETQTKIINTSIYSLHVNQGIEGHFFLGSGVINGIEKYTFYKDAGGGGMVRDSVPTEGTVIYQDEDQSPYLIKIYSVDVNTATNEEDRWIYWVKYELHVPKGTVVEGYQI